MRWDLWPCFQLLNSNSLRADGEGAFSSGTLEQLAWRAPARKRFCMQLSSLLIRVTWCWKVLVQLARKFCIHDTCILNKWLYHWPPWSTLLFVSFDRRKPPANSGNSPFVFISCLAFLLSLVSRFIIEQFISFNFLMEWSMLLIILCDMKRCLQFVINF